ncbi:hypothetical protein [Kocuria turfanensis]|uniref:Uncharacterized protein n=1 Tax=Kocuria turfanensis TaxID=388357 RepID=A0A512I9V7_9MICC|nr:hypothetical protein [Kocuria turfanensis]GEO94427.1 hypothetical protein KTU01_05500 [Kocuria turfanensis]
MSEQQREQGPAQEPGRGPVGDQREDGVVVEPGAELDRDLARQGLEDEGDRA